MTKPIPPETPPENVSVAFSWFCAAVLLALLVASVVTEVCVL